MTLNEHARAILASLTAMEATLPDRAKEHHRAIAVHHKALAALVVEHGQALGLDDDIIALAAAPKKEPDNP